MKNNYWVAPLALLAAGAGVAIYATNQRISNLEEELAKVRNEKVKIQITYSDPTNQPLQADSSTNSIPATNSTPTLSRKTPDAIRYAENLNQAQSTKPAMPAGAYR